MVARVVPQSARRRHAESRKPDLRRGECFQVQEYQQVDFLLGPATGKQGAVGHERRHRLFAYAWCLYARGRSTDTWRDHSSGPRGKPEPLG